MTWVLLALLGGISFGLMRLFGMPRSLWSFVGAALMLGATGYALQANPGYAGAPASGAQPVKDDEGVLQLREIRGDLFGRFTARDAAFAPADALMRSGKSKTAAHLMLGAVRQNPNDPAMWTWLGITLVEAENGNLSPAAALAFRRGVSLAPTQAGPPFFYGMALARTGETQRGLNWLMRALEVSDPNSQYRKDIARIIIQIRMMQAMQERERQAAQPQ